MYCEHVYTPQNKVKLKFKLSGEGQQRFTRADTLGDEFEPNAIIETIDKNMYRVVVGFHSGFCYAEGGVGDAEEGHETVQTSRLPQPD